MTCTIEKVLSDARLLVNRLREHETEADGLISQGQVLQKRVDAMKHYQEDLNELNEVARHRPRSSLIINLLQENTQIRELQQENKELRQALDEHQSALEMIMTKYRQQVLKLVLAGRLDRKVSSGQKPPATEQEQRIEKICEMAAVMKQAILVDDDAVAREQQLVAQLKLENNTLRELLHIAGGATGQKESADISCQTEDGAEGAEGDSEGADMNSIIDKMFDLNSSIISVKSCSAANEQSPSHSHNQADGSHDQESDLDTSIDSISSGNTTVIECSASEAEDNESSPPDDKD